MSAVHAEPVLVRICDLAGRPRGTGFVADDAGTVVTSHEAVDGLVRAVVHAPCGISHLAEADDITPLPEWDLALIRTEELGVAPLVIGAERARAAGTAVRLRTGHHTPQRTSRWTDARLAGTASVTYTSTERFHALEEVLELALPEGAGVELRLSRRASGTPVVDADTGAVLAVLGTALHTPHRAAGFAVPLRTAGLLEPDGPLGMLLARNGASVPGFGPDLNLAGALRLTRATLEPAVESAGRNSPVLAPVPVCASKVVQASAPAPASVHRPEVADAFRQFEESGASVAGLVGSPGTGRTTELTAHAARRSGGDAPGPTVWLRGADLRAGDGSVREAVGRALAEAGRVVAASGREEVTPSAPDTEPAMGDAGAPCADVVARLARDAKRPLLVLLDAPEEMPPRLAHELRQWTAGTAGWLRASGARMIVACGPEHWEQAGALFPLPLLYGAVGEPTGGQSGTALPACVRLGDLPPGQAARARERYGLPDGALDAGDAGHPLAMRMLAEIRAAQGADGCDGRADGGRAETGPADELPTGNGTSAHRPADDGPAAPSRTEIFSAYLDLASLRIANRLPAAQRRTGRDGGAVRRLAARSAGRLHEAARRCLGPGQGGLDGPAFDEVFPQVDGWGPAVLMEGMFVPAGDGYRFADEEFADWLQGRHLELDAALDTLVHRRTEQPGTVPVPRHRIGSVVHALLLCAQLDGPYALERRLRPLVDACVPADVREGSRGAGGGPGSLVGAPRIAHHGRTARNGRTDVAWWAGHLLGETLLRVPDVRPYSGVLRALAERIAGDGHSGDFGPWFWRRLSLPTADRVELLRILLPADPPHDAVGGRRPERYLDVAAELLAAEPATVQPVLCAWFSDQRPLRRRADAPDALRPTVAAAAQALLHTHRGHAPNHLIDLLDLLIDVGHPRAGELLTEFAHDEPTAFCRAVDRWAHDEQAERRAAAAEYGLPAARHARTDVDRGLLQHAALALLCRPAEPVVHASALALLVRDPGRRDQHLDAALAHLAATGAPVLADALVSTLGDRPERVLAAFRARLRQPGSGARAVLEPLADVRSPDLARRIAALVREYAELRPETAGDAVAAFVRRRLTHGIAARAALRPLTDALLCTPYVPLRAGLAGALGGARGPLRDELIDVLLRGEREPAVLDAALAAVVRGEGDGPGVECSGREQGELVRRIGLLMAGTAEGAACFDRRMVELAREVPGFAALLGAWAAEAPAAWLAVVGPSARRTCESLADRT